MFNKRVLKKAVDELNKAKKPAKQKDIIVDPKGQWAHPGQVTRIPSNKITMQGVGYPVLGVPNKGQPKMMMPGQYFEFPEADYVDEYPQMQDGGQIYTYAKRPGSYYKKDSKGNWMIKNESTHGKYVAIDDPKGTRSKALNAQAKPLQKAPQVKETLVSEIKTIPKDNTFYDSTLQPGESTAVRNIIQKKIPDVIGKDAMTYLKEQKQKKEKAINKYIRAKNEKVQQFYKEYHESPRYNEMLSKSSPDKYEDYAAGRMINLEGYNDLNMSKPHLYIRHKQPKDSPGTGGFSRSSTGDVTVLPLGFSGKGMLPHEWSHSSDRPISLGINPFTGKNFKVPLHDRLIPKKDEQWITKHKPKTWLDSPEFKSMSPEDRKIYKKYPEIISDQEEFMNYVGEPTETRARLNDIRFQSKQRGIYDPFTEKVTPAIFKKLLKTKFESKGNEGFDALQQLKGVYTDEEIEWMLNNISKNQQAEEEGAQSFGRYGGQFQDGGEKDKWGRPKGSKWYGFDPKTKKYTTKDNWGRSANDKWYGFNPDNKSWSLANQGNKTNKTPVPKEYKLEEDIVDPLLGSPQKKGAKFANGVDNLRHSMSSYYTAKGLQPYLGAPASIVGANVLGAAHEVKRIFDDPDDWSTKLRTSGEDMFNNAVGSAMSILPESWAKGSLKYLSDNNLLPDGVDYEGRDLYVKQKGGAYQFYKQFQEGGDLDSEVDLTVLPEDGRSYYDPVLDQMYLNPFADKEEINHELTHAWQNRTGALRSDPLSPKMRPPAAVTDEQAATYFNRKGDDVQYYLDNLQSIHPEMTGNIWTPDMSAFIPEEVQYNRAIDPLMYYDAGTMEGEAEMMSQRYGPPPLEISYEKDGGVPQYAPGGSTGCPPGSYWNGKECVKSFIPVAKQTPKPVVKNKKEQELIDYGKKTLPSKKVASKPIDNIPFYGDISEAAQPDDLQENIIEFFDQTGVFSWDDAYRAKAAWDKSGSTLPTVDQSLDMFGAVPALGKLGKLKYLKNASAIKNSMKYVAPAFGVIPWQSILNAVDTGQDINQDNVKYQDGGQYKTKLTPEEEFDFQSFFRTLPDNLQTDDDTYDIRGYWDSEGRPGAFNYDQPTEDDGYYHAYSINQNTGEYLKSPAHDTFQHAVDEDRKIGYRPITNIQGRNIAVENQSIADPEEQSYLRNMEGPANYIELDLTPEEIQEYAKGGYIIEDISVPSLTKAQKGGIFGRRKRRKEQEAQQQQPQYVAPVEVDDELYESVTPYTQAPEDFKKGVGNIKEVGVAAKAPEWLKFSREYEDKNSRQAFIDKKKRDYLKNTNKGLAKAAGLNMENFPEQVERNFANEYDYKKNSYVMKKLSKTKGFSLKRRGEWVDELTKPERQILADSKYESKLQPSIWARTNAGLRTLYDQIKGKQYSNLGRRETYEGMTAKESQDIQDQGLLGALNTFAILEAPGYILANLANRTGGLSYGSDYRKDSDFDPWGEVELMSGVSPLQATIFNPLTYTAPYDLVSAGPSLFTAARNLVKRPGAVRAAEELATVRPALTAGAEEATVAGINRPRRLMDVVETDPNAYRQVASGTIKPETRLLPEATNRDLVIPDDANFGNPPFPDELYDEIYATEPSLNYGEPRPWENTFSGLTADDLDYDYITQAYKDKAMNELNAGNITRRDIAAPTDQFNVPPPETYYQPFDPTVGQQEIDELRRIYHTAERNLTPEEARALSQEGVGSQSDYMPENFGEDFDATDLGEYQARADANNVLIEKKDKLAKIDDHISWLDDEYKSLNLDQYSTAADIPEPIAKRATEIELEITRLTDQRNAKINPPAPAQRTPAFRIVNGQVISEELAFAKDVLQQQLGLPANADMPGMIQAVNRMDMTDPVRVDFEQALIGEGLDPNDIYAEARPSSTTIRHQLPVDRVDEIAENPFAGLRGEKSKSTAEISPFVAAQIDRTIVPGTNRSVADILGSHTNPLDAVRDVRSFVQDGLMSEFSGRDVMEALREEIRKMPVSGDEKKFLIKEAKRISNAPKSQAYTGSNVTEDQAVKYISAIPEQEIQDIASQYGYTPQDVENATNRWRNNSAVYDVIINQAYDDFKYMREHNMPNPNPRAFDFQTGTPSPSLLKKGELDNLALPKKDMDLIKKTKYDMSTRNTSGTIGYSDVDDPTVYTITDMNMIPKTEDLDDMIAAYEKAYKEASGGLKDELEMQLEDLRSTKWLRTEYAKELKAEGLNPTEIEKVTVISNSSNQKNLIKGNGEVIGTLNVGKGKLSTGEPGVKIGSSGVALRFHPYRVGSKHSKYKTWEGAQQALEKRIFDKEIATISNPADRSNPIVIKSLKKKAKTEADKVIDRLKENNNNNYGEALYRGVHNGTKETRGSLFTRQSFAPTSLEDPVTGLPDFRKRAENFWGSQQRQINELGIPKAELLPVPEAFKNDQWYTPDIVMRRKLGGNTNKLNKFIR